LQQLKLETKLVETEFLLVTRSSPDLSGVGEKPLAIGRKKWCLGKKNHQRKKWLLELNNNYGKKHNS
jgi:hypothetical protein